MPILRSREIIPKTPLKKTLETPLNLSTPSKTDAVPPPLSSSTPSPSSTLESGFLSSGAATPPRRRSLRLASISTTIPVAAIPTEENSSRRKRKVRVSGSPQEGEIRALEESGSMNLRSGTRIARRRFGDEERDRSEEREKGKLGFRGDCFEVTGDPMILEIGGRKIGGSEEKLDFETIVVEEAEEHSQIADGLMKDRRTRRKKGGNKFQREEKRSEVLELEPKVAAFKPDENDVKGKSKFVDKENWLSIDGVAEKMDFEATVEEEVEEKPQIEDGLMKRRRTWRAKEECRIEVIELVSEVASFKSEEKDGEEEEILGLFSNMGERDGEGNGELEASLSKMADSSREDGMMRGIEVSSVSSDLAGKDGDQKVFSEERLKLILDVDCIEKISDKMVIDMGRGSMKDGGVEIGKTEICTDRRICSKEEKGKGKLVVEEDHMLIDKDEVKLEAGPIVVQEVGECTRNGEVSVKHRKGRKAKRSTKSRKEAERIRAIDLAPKFAFFKAEQEGSEEEEPEDFAANADQDWPGPFSTAMKIIEEREQKLRARELNSSSKKDEDTENRIQWVPSNDRKFKPFGKSAPTLNDLCMKVLCKNAEEIESLDGVPDVLKHRLISLLSRSRKMSLRILGLLVSGSPTEIHLSDCSWATEGQFGGVLDGCNVDNLKVVQLDFCGRCMPDYVLQATLARSPNCLPSLTTISLKGDYRLSDDGLNAIAASAPFLGSINLSQCSLLTSTGIIALADKLQSVLRELYIDDCQNVDAMLILPALKKLKYLEALSIAGIETVCDKFVKKLIFDCGANLRELVIAGCRKLTAASIQTIGESCSQLRSLDLRNLNRLNDSAIGHLANGCRSIQKLKLCRNALRLLELIDIDFASVQLNKCVLPKCSLTQGIPNFNGASDEAIAAFVEASGGSLTELSLNNVEKVAKHTAVAISRRCSSTLRSLDLSFCRKMTDEALGLIVDSCSNLRILKLFGCTQVTDVFLEGHSNSLVKIVGLKGPIFEQIEMPDFLYCNFSQVGFCKFKFCWFLQMDWNSLSTRLHPVFAPSVVFKWQARLCHGTTLMTVFEKYWLSSPLALGTGRNNNNNGTDRF